MAIGTIWRTVGVIDMPDGTIATNNQYLLSSGTIGIADYTELKDEVRGWYNRMYDDISANSSSAADPREVEVYSVDNLTGEEISIGIAALTQNFLGIGDMCPHGVAGLITAKVDAGRGTSKMFFPAIDGDDLTGSGTLSASYVTALAAAATEWLTGPLDVQAITLTPITWNPTTKTHKVVGTVAIASDVPAYQRRRKPGVGI